ncbi:ATP-dependent protease La [Meredithblackwellia eburnea MCA 4105]
MVNEYNINTVLPVLALPPNQILFPNNIISLQLASKHSTNLISDLLAESQNSSGNKHLIVVCAPIRSQDDHATPPTSNNNDNNNNQSGLVTDKSNIPNNQNSNTPTTPPPSDRDDDDDSNPTTGNLKPGQAPHNSNSTKNKYRAEANNKPNQDQIFSHGTAARIIRLERLSSSTSPSPSGYLVVLEGLTRVQLVSFLPDNIAPRYPIANLVVLPFPSTEPLPQTHGHLVPLLQSTTEALLHAMDTTTTPLPALTKRRLKSFLSGLSPSTLPTLLDILFSSLPSPFPLPFSSKLDHLSLPTTVERTEAAIAVFSRVREIVDVKKRIQGRVTEAVGRKQREWVLLQQLKAIREELEGLAREEDKANGRTPTSSRGIAPKSKGKLLPPSDGGQNENNDDEEEEEDEDDSDDLAELSAKLKLKQWPAENPLVRKTAYREFRRLKKSPPQGAEHGVIRNYLDWLLAVPWCATTIPAEGGEGARVKGREFVKEARRKLDEDHFGLEKIKKRLLEWLAVLRLQEEEYERLLELDKKKELQDRAATAASKLNDDGAKTVPAIEPSTDESTTSKAVVLRDPSVPAPPVPSTAPIRRPRPKSRAPILLLCGPPGTGKTSIARSLASSMGRSFHRISLGGVRDEAEIRGHRRTYVAAMPGAIAQALRTTGRNDPVILLDEIDKLGNGGGTHGDPSAAMLEVLDPEQNWCFQDHYLGLPLDLSNVLFIATANTLDTISDPLYDRMEVIELSGYVHDEKAHIARQYLIPKQLTFNALPKDQFEMTDDALMHLITHYTREAGVRTVERQLGAVIRAKAVEFSEARDAALGVGVGEGGEAGKVLTYDKVVRKEDLERLLGVERYDAEVLDRENLVGVSTGLAYQGSGNGGILHIESTSMPGSGHLSLTGQLGDVISESAHLAFAWVKSHAYELGLADARDVDAFKNIDIHVHLPAGSIKKDGPSAGVALVVAIVSLMRGLRVRQGVAMTGEITLRGNVTPVGGIKEKVLAAHRAGLRTLLLPYKNEKDVVADLPQSARDELTFVYVHTIWEALEAAFGARLWDGTDRRRVGDFAESRL